MKMLTNIVAVVGALNIDIGGRPEETYVAGDSIPGKVITAFGGVGWNIARDCAALGAQTELWSILGRDEHESGIRQEAADMGISLAHCQWADAPNNRYLYICGKDGDMIAAINDMRLCDTIDEAFIRACLPALSAYDVVVADANLPLETLRTLAEGLTVPLVVDCVSAVKCGRLSVCLDKIDTIKANRMEAETLTGKTSPEACIKALLSAGVKRAVISLGREGALCGTRSEMFYLPAEDVPVVDTTGAGDSVTAALAVGRAKGLDLHACAKLGMAAAGITMGQPGAVTKRLSQLAEII